MEAPQSYRADPPLFCDTIETGGGPIAFAVDADAVRELRMGATTARTPRAPALLRETRRQLAQYFRGRRDAFDLPFVLDTPAFTTEVLESVAEIPWGATLSYGEVAARVHNPRAARAVGQAVGINPLPVLIPCHRVLAAGRRLGGFGCGLGWKRFLLRLEGVSWK